MMFKTKTGENIFVRTDMIERIYSGKSRGCMCGCVGKYYETVPQKYKILKKMFGHCLHEQFANTETMMDDSILFTDDGKKLYVVYFKTKEQKNENGTV